MCYESFKTNHFTFYRSFILFERHTVAATSNTEPLADTACAQLPKALTLKGDALPFTDGKAWLAHAHSNNKKARYVIRSGLFWFIGLVYLTRITHTNCDTRDGDHHGTL